MSLRPHALACFLLAPLVLAACRESPTEASRLASVSVNATEFTAARVNPESEIPAYEVTVVTRIRNVSAAPLYLSACGPLPPPIYDVELVRPADPNGTAFGVVWACPGARWFDLPAGAERTDTLTLRAPGRVQNGQALGAVDGTVRVTFLAVTCRTEAECGTRGARSVQLQSPAFTIRRP